MPDHTPQPGRPATDGVELAPTVRVAPEAIRFSFSRSAGPGGQNVNKRSTRAELRIALHDIPLDGGARARLRRLAGSRLTDEGEILLVSDETRSQRQNRDLCLERLRELVTRALVRPKPRKPTKPTKSSVRRRLDEKSNRAKTKQRRRTPPNDHG